MLKKAALWTYWEGRLSRHGPRRRRDARHSDRRARTAGSGTSRSTTTSISVGVVASYEYLFKNRPRQDHETDLLRRGRSLPGPEAAAGQGASARRRIGAAKEYSYRAKKAAGDGWVLVGDAFGFLDPLYSSGVLLALKIGPDGGRRDLRRLAKGDTSARAARQMGAGLRRKAWTGCGGWSATTTTASASAGSSNAFRI